jgi:excisionase family DNA binding protein
VTHKGALTLPEAADYCSVSERTLRNAIKEGHLVARRAGSNRGKLVFRIKDLEDYLEALPTDKRSA